MLRNFLLQLVECVSTVCTSLKIKKIHRATIIAPFIGIISVWAAIITIYQFYGPFEFLNERVELKNEDRVRQIVVKHLGVEARKVTGEANFVNDLGADDLDMIELVMAFETEFKLAVWILVGWMRWELELRWGVGWSGCK